MNEDQEEASEHLLHPDPATGVLTAHRPGLLDPKWEVAVACIYLELLFGLTTSFPVFSAGLKHTLHLDQVDLSWCATLGALGAYLSIFAGLFINMAGTRLTALVGGVISCTGFLTTYLMTTTAGHGSWGAAWGLCLAFHGLTWLDTAATVALVSHLVCCACRLTWLDTAATVALVSRFRLDQGLAVGVAKAQVGLGTGSLVILSASLLQYRTRAPYPSSSPTCLGDLYVGDGRQYAKEGDQAIKLIVGTLVRPGNEAEELINHHTHLPGLPVLLFTGLVVLFVSALASRRLPSRDQTRQLLRGAHVHVHGVANRWLGVPDHIGQNGITGRNGEEEQEESKEQEDTEEELFPLTARGRRVFLLAYACTFLIMLYLVLVSALNSRWRRMDNEHDFRWLLYVCTTSVCISRVGKMMFTLLLLLLLSVSLHVYAVYSFQACVGHHVHIALAAADALAAVDADAADAAAAVYVCAMMFLLSWPVLEMMFTWLVLLLMLMLLLVC
eukprot:g34563.t1